MKELARPLLREPLTWLGVAAIALGACAPALGDLLDGGEDELTFVDEDVGVEVTVEADDCEADDGGTICDYDIELTGIYGQPYTATVTLWHGPGGAVEVREATDLFAASFDGELPLLLDGAAKGDEEDVAESGNRYTVELDDVGDEAEDADGETHGNCKRWHYAFHDRSRTEVDAWVCPDIGLTQVDIVGDVPLSLKREP